MASCWPRVSRTPPPDPRPASWTSRRTSPRARTAGRPAPCPTPTTPTRRRPTGRRSTPSAAASRWATAPTVRTVGTARPAADLTVTPSGHNGVMSAGTTHWVLHVDLDQFIAAVEVLRCPELAGRPVIVGGRGDPTERAVVSTASYEAREFGVRSGMPLKTAVRRCPDAVLLPVDSVAYDAASATVMAALRAVPGAAVRVLGWDEAFVGITAD